MQQDPYGDAESLFRAFYQGVVRVAYSLAGNKVAFYNLGSLGVGGQANATIVVRPLSAGTITNTANTASGVLEPLKAHATASVKTLVESLVMTITQAGTNVVITWTSDASGFNLEYATNLQPPIAWAPWTGPIPFPTTKTH